MTVHLNYTAIPETLREKKAWCVWKLEDRQDKQGIVAPTKVPYHPGSGCRSASNRPATWASYEFALDRYERAKRWGQIKGIGVFVHSDLVGVDLDKVRDPATGEIEPEAQEIIRLFNSYTEVSPSGTGIRIFVRGHTPEADRRKRRYEMYGVPSNRFLTVTGCHVVDTPLEVEPRQEAIDEFHRRWIFRPENQRVAASSPSSVTVTPLVPQACTRTEEEIIELCSADQDTGLQFMRLWAGDWSDYPSQSEADGRLVGLLSVYAGPDPSVIDALFRQSGLMRAKWDQARGGRTYGQMTIERFANRKLDYAHMYLPEDLEGIIRPFELEPDPAPPPADTSKRRRLLTLHELYALPDPEWLVKDHIPKMGFVVIAGPSGCGKSFLALDMGRSVASGLPFLSVYPVERGPVVYLCSEGSGGMKYRNKAWELQRKCDDGQWFRPCPHAFNMLDTVETEAFLMMLVNDLGYKPALVVVDTLARNFGGGDENSAKDMGQFVHNLDIIRERAKCAVAVIHHTGKDQSKGERGSSALRGAADTLLLCDHHDGKRGLLVACDKQKDAVEFPPYVLTKKVVNVGTNAEGEMVTSLALEPANEWDTKFRFLKQPEKDFIRELFAGFGPRAFTWQDARKLSASAGTCSRYMKKLEREELIVMNHKGTHYLINEKILPALVGS